MPEAESVAPGWSGYFFRLFTDEAICYYVRTNPGKGDESYANRCQHNGSRHMTGNSSLPVSRVPDSRTAPPLRWGIMGPGWIAERFTESVQAHTSQIIAAIGSRSLDRSEAFAGRHGITAAFGSYEELAAADVDIVY